MAALSLTVLGARGSMPVSGDAYVRYGGRTTAFTVTAGDTTLLVDCGTGVVETPELGTKDVAVFLTHYHTDHLEGLRFLKPLYEEDKSFTFYGHHPGGMSMADAISGTFKPPFFPVAFENTPSKKRFAELGPDALAVGDIEVSHARLNHPQGVVGYRFSHEGKSIVVATDHEAGDASADAILKTLAAGADVLIHDAQYTPDDYDEYRGWGHSTWEDAVAAADAAGVKSLVLTSHDPSRSDGEIDDIVALAQARFPRTTAAHEGMVIDPSASAS